MTASVLVAERYEVSSERSVTASPTGDTRGRMAATDSYWLATMRPDGRPHVLPVLEVWLDGALYVSAGYFASGTKDQADGACFVISIGGHALDPVVEGDAKPVSDGDTLRRVAAAYRARYGWPAGPRPGGFGDDGAGTLPYEVYEATPTTVISFDSESPFDATRWLF